AAGGHARKYRLAARRKGHPLLAIAGRHADRLRPGDAHGPVPRRQRRGDDRAPESRHDLQKRAGPSRDPGLSPRPLRVALENRTDSRVLPAIWIANQALDGLLKRRKPILNAKRLLTNQIFRDIYRTDTLAIGQRLKILSLTFLFSDLKGSTARYDPIGALVAFALVTAHFSP